MGKTGKILNLIALAVFLGSNFLTPLSYAFEEPHPGEGNHEVVGEIESETSMNSSVSDSEGQGDAQIDKDEAYFIEEDAEQSEAEELSGSEEILSPSNSSFKKEQNDGDIQNFSEPLPNPLLTKERESDDEIGAGEVNAQPPRTKLLKKKMILN